MKIIALISCFLIIMCQAMHIRTTNQEDTVCPDSVIENIWDKTEYLEGGARYSFNSLCS